MSVVRRLLSEAGIYGLAAALTSLVGIVLVPLYARTFTPLEYGVISLVNSTNALTAILIVCALDNSSAVWYWDQREPADRSRTFSSWFFTSLVFGVAVGCIMLLGRRLFANALGGAQYELVVVLVACAQPFLSLPRVGNLWFRNERRPLLAVTLALISSVATAGSCVTLVRFFHLGLIGVAAGQLAGIIVASIAARVLLRGVVRLSAFELPRARKMVRFSSPLMLSSVFAWCMGPAAPYVLAAFGLRSDAGLFQIGSSLASVAGFAIFAFCQAWTPFALEISREERAPSTYAVVVEVFLAVGLLGALFVHAAGAELLRWFTGPRYVGAGHAAFLLVLVQVTLGLPQVFGISFTIAKSVRPLAWATALGALTTLLGFVFLVPRLAKDGAALSVFIGACASVSYSFWASQRAYPVPIRSGRVLAVLATFVIAVVAIFVLDQPAISATTSLVGRVLLLVGYAMVVLLLYRGLIARARFSARAPAPAAPDPES